MIRRLLLFPGVISHELSHFFMCLILGVKVTKFSLSFRNLSGFVQHKVPKSILKSMLIGIAPSVFALIASAILLNIYTENRYLEWGKHYLVFVWLFTSFPSIEDTNFSYAHHWVKKVLTFPLFILFRIFHYIGRNEVLRALTSLVIMLCVYALRILYEVKILYTP